jgi:hypothetical protein
MFNYIFNPFGERMVRQAVGATKMIHITRIRFILFRTDEHGNKLTLTFTVLELKLHTMEAFY